ncbi:VOC family protein [Agromyces archimandritae]|uniref:Glyoxalase-like domain-containing protein n=1 Tax=Agromyces archimandritae TaxID=2781962 RepID=A0A975FP79_9MICO|nr:VOC family protein [Agromyces archimandritae]QTX06063.1 hypothetical protein G127AT_07795 [Agromyces archimandritae]
MTGREGRNEDAHECDREPGIAVHPHAAGYAAVTGASTQRLSRCGFVEGTLTRHGEENVGSASGQDPVTEGERAAVILWTDDAPAGYRRLLELGARPVKEPEPWLGRLLIVWVKDPDGRLIQVVQDKPTA